ncbi:MAG TPA: hypothetical protein VNP73_00370, partial [Actinomycetota bacterium]|nr:hypothetical protein [Actinomycetota bacterium]
METPIPTSTGGPAWNELGEIEYVLPDELPTGWTVKVATERPGRPVGEWTDHFEVLENRVRKSLLVLGAHHPTSEEDESLLDTAGEIKDLSNDNFAFLLVFAVPHDAATTLPAKSRIRGI